MIRALIVKELRQHGAAFLVLGGLLLIGLLGIAGNPLLKRALGSSFEGLQLLLRTLVPLGALVLSNAVISAEFRNKTQLFLEGLPLPRWRMLAIKYALMLGALLAAAGLAAAAAGWRGHRGEAMTLGFALLVAAKTAAWTWFVGSVGFAVGFLGRYRAGIAIVTVIVLSWLTSTGQLELGRHAPVSLLDERFAYEREIWPWGALLLTAGWAMAFSALGFGLGLVRDATLATLLAEKMSSREKVWLTLSMLTLIIVLAMADERRKNLEAVTLPGSVTHEPAAGVRLEITSAQMPTASETAALMRVGTNLAASMAEFSRAIGGRLPTLFLVHRSDLQPGEVRYGDLSPEQGVLLRANLVLTNFNLPQLEHEMVRQILKARTHGRSEKELWAWLADGFPGWWSSRAGATNGLAANPALAGHARDAREKVASSNKMFECWLSVRRDTGQQGAEALSWSALQTISSEHGPEAVLRLLRECFGATVSKDVRAWLREKSYPPEERLRHTTGMDFAKLALELDHELSRSHTYPGETKR